MAYAWMQANTVYPALGKDLIHVQYIHVTLKPKRNLFWLILLGMSAILVSLKNLLHQYFKFEVLCGARENVHLPSQLPNTNPSWAVILTWFTAPVLTHYICLCYLPGIIKVFRLVDSVQQSVIFCCKHLLLLQQCCNLPYVPTEYIYIARRKHTTCTDLIYRNIIA